MAKINASASMGIKLKIFSEFENVNPHVSIGIERDVDESFSAEQQVQLAGEMYKLCRKFVQDEIEKDIASAKAGKDGKYIGKKVK